MAALVATPALAKSDWEKFYHPIWQGDELLPSEADPEVLASTGGFNDDLVMMWRRGFALLGYTYFNSPNSKTKDAERFAKKLKARYLIVSSHLTSSSTRSVPLTLPNTTTSMTSGTANAWGSGGYATGTYNGTTTTYGSQTTYIPITVNRFDKVGMYFAEAPKEGAGALFRDLNSGEVTLLGTRRAMAVIAVRDNSPAYYADILPGDLITNVGEQPADRENWKAAMRRAEVHTIRVYRNGQFREIQLEIPDELRPE